MLFIAQAFGLLLKKKGRRKRDRHVYRNVCGLEDDATRERARGWRGQLERLRTRAGLTEQDRAACKWAEGPAPSDDCVVPG